ncbi:MAG: hypothetical protein H6741_35405 [Alphaproteobacteria bacterium]|nr:hypothetical protein [Alphaproteobacteria bacterium]
MISRRILLIRGASGATLLTIAGLPDLALADGDAEITLKAASVQPTGSPWSRHLSKLKLRIKANGEQRESKPVIEVVTRGAVDREEEAKLQQWKRERTPLTCDLRQGGETKVEGVPGKLTDVTVTETQASIALTCSVDLTDTQIASIQKMATN